MEQGLTLLYAEDNEDDVFLFNHALERARIDATLRIVPNGESVIQYLEGTGEYTDRSTNPVPDVVFIGWRIAGVVSGAKFLEWCRQSPVCASLTVVVLTGAGLEADIDEAMRLGANLAIAKPTSIQALTDRLTEICNSAALKKRQAGY